MDPIDRQLLDVLQRGVPLEKEPFAVLAEELDLNPGQVLSRVRALRESGIIRQIGPIFDSRRLGYHSTLAAFRVEEDRLDRVAQRVSAHPGVSHNYSRNHLFNLWFTLTLPGDQDLRSEIERLAEESGVAEHLYLPALRVFKIGVHFALAADRSDDAPRSRRADKEPLPLSPFQRDLIRALQGHLPLQRRPFRPAAAQLGVSEEVLLEAARELERQGAMRRFAAVLRHRRVGYTANGMACWVVPQERLLAAGQEAAAFRQVSHCYERPAYPPHWPYNLFTMIHGQKREEVEAIAAQIRRRIEPIEHTVLYSQKEYKKKRVEYFV